MLAWPTQQRRAASIPFWLDGHLGQSSAGIVCAAGCIGRRGHRVIAEGSSLLCSRLCRRCSCRLASGNTIVMACYCRSSHPSGPRRVAEPALSGHWPLATGLSWRGPLKQSFQVSAAWPALPPPGLARCAIGNIERPQAPSRDRGGSAWLRAASACGSNRTSYAHTPAARTRHTRHPPPSSGSRSSSLARPVQQSSRPGERTARLPPHRLLW